ncbi:MAG: hypothetical protein R2710_18625 [Acidimicrobiales bacterium]
MPPCRRGCGGCDWQHIAIGAQHDLRLRIVTDALERIGKLPSPPVIAGAPLESERYRTTIRAAVSGDRAVTALPSRIGSSSRTIA